jgi:hypothetical protein
VSAVTLCAHCNCVVAPSHGRVSGRLCWLAEVVRLSASASRPSWHCSSCAAGCLCCTTQALAPVPPLAHSVARAHAVPVLCRVASLLAPLLLLSHGLGALLPPAAALLRPGAVTSTPLCSAACACGCAGSRCRVPLSCAVALRDVDGHLASARLRRSARGRRALWGPFSPLADVATLFMLCRVHVNRSPRCCPFSNMRSTSFSASITRISG